MLRIFFMKKKKLKTVLITSISILLTQALINKNKLDDRRFTIMIYGECRQPKRIYSDRLKIMQILSEWINCTSERLFNLVKRPFWIKEVFLIMLSLQNPNLLLLSAFFVKIRKHSFWAIEFKVTRNGSEINFENVLLG